ncbi:MAG: hypothetical protein JW943_08260 [Deltaproteobacteria bacterium]|nr:hypothetical protein [Deltaproteobacteria bacterium]
MNDFWDDVLKDKIANKPINAAWEDLSREASFRPIIYIGAGGFGCNIIRNLKADIDKLIPDQTIKDGFAFIGLDTHPRDQNDILTEVEYASLAVGIEPNSVARDPEFSRHLGWFRELAGNWNAGSILAANKVRSVGRIAFLFPASLTAFYNNLNAAFNRINAFRQNFGPDVSPKIYVITSLAGGTGAGLFIDLLTIIRSYLTSQLGQKYILQAILATPEALEGEAPPTDYPEFYANTYSSLKEIFHFIRGKEELVSYGIDGSGLEKIKITTQHMPHHIFLITDRNMKGKPVVNTLPELGAMVKSYLLFEIQTPLMTSGGAPKVQDGENRRFDTPGHGNMPRVFSSIGVVRFGLPYEEITQLFTSSIIRRAMSDEISGICNVADIDGWIACQELAEVDTDQLQDSLRKDKEGHAIRVPLDVEGDLANLKIAEYGKSCKSLKDDKLRAINETVKPIIQGNASSHLDKAGQNLEATFNEKARDRSIGEALSFVRSLNDLLKQQKEVLTKELDAGRKTLEKADQKVKQGISNVAEAATSGFWGKKSRVQCAVTSFGGDLEAMLNQQIIVWAQEEGVNLYDKLLSICEKLISDWAVVENTYLSRLENIKKTIVALIDKINSMAEINKRSDGNRFSIVNSSNVKTLYSEFFSDQVESAIALRARKDWRAKSLLNDTLTKDKNWIPLAMSAITDEVHDKIKGLDIMNVIERFYAEGTERDTLMTTVKALGSPLFPLDESKQEPLYMTDRVVAVHPSIRGKFTAFFARYKGAQEGMSDAYFSTTHEVIIYSITHGYTAHSLSRISYYKAQYDYLYKKYQELTAKKIPFRPIHTWAGADVWDDLMPKPPGEEDAYKLFIVGRAFNHLYPEAKAQSFIYNKGSYYYLLSEKGKPEKLGNSLETAIEKFSDNPEWQKKIEQEIAAKIGGLGTAEIKQRIESEYMPIIDAEIENSEKGRERDRLRILRDLRALLAEFIESDLKERKV